MTRDKLEQFYDNHLDQPSFNVNISSIKNEYVDCEENCFTKEQFENGREIHQKLAKHFAKFGEKCKKEDKANGIYGFFLKNIRDSKNIVYIGQYHLPMQRKMERLYRHIRTIYKVFSSGGLSSVKHESLYLKLIKLMVEENSMVNFVTIPNLPYPGQILEGAIKIAHVCSGYENYPQLINKKFEALVTKPYLKYIFKKCDDFIDYTHFMMHNLCKNVFREQHLKNKECKNGI